MHFNISSMDKKCLNIFPCVSWKKYSFLVFAVAATETNNAETNNSACNMWALRATSDRNSVHSLCIEGAQCVSLI